MAHEVVQERDRLGRQVQLAPGQLDAAAGALQDEVAGHQARRRRQRLAHPAGATQDRADARGQLGRVEGLGQVVVGAVVTVPVDVKLLFST